MSRPEKESVHANQPESMADRRPWLVVIGMFCAVFVPAYFAIDSVTDIRPYPPFRPDISPHGYTFSLLLWAVPIFFAVISLRKKLFDRTQIQLWGAGITFILMTVLSVSLEVLLGLRFYNFENTQATIGIDIPVFGGVIPIEEFGFYILGYVAVLLFYLWCDEVWLTRYNPLDYEQHIQRTMRGDVEGKLEDVEKFLRSIHLRFAMVSILTAGVTGAILLSSTKWPQYLLFLVAASMLPVVAFISLTREFINWRAFSLVFFACLLVSLLWESTLGVPYRWWGYNSDYMLHALQARPWSNLPAEAYIVWILAPFTIVAVYEMVKVWRTAWVLKGKLVEQLGKVAPSGIPTPNKIPGFGENV